jgi:hypothetical protein
VNYVEVQQLLGHSVQTTIPNILTHKTEKDRQTDTGIVELPRDCSGPEEL